MGSAYWMMEHTSVDAVCPGPGLAILARLPYGFAHLVVANAVLEQMQPEEKCRAMSHLMRILRSGGNLWIGWDTEQHKDPAFWGDCLNHLSVKSWMEVHNESLVFGKTEHDFTWSSSVFVRKER